jgi:hypothetical protein
MSWMVNRTTLACAHTGQRITMHARERRRRLMVPRLGLAEQFVEFGSRACGIKPRITHHRWEAAKTSGDNTTNGPADLVQMRKMSGQIEKTLRIPEV